MSLSEVWLVTVTYVRGRPVARPWTQFFSAVSSACAYEYIRLYTHIILYYTYTAYVYCICMSVNDFVRTRISLLHLRNALSNTAQNIRRIHTFFLEWTTLPITVACFVDNIMWRQLAPLYPKVPDIFRNTLQGHAISASFWTVAYERVPRSGMHYSNL